MRIELPDNHISKVLEQDVKAICSPLFKDTKIEYFHYARVYKNGLSFSLTTNCQWHKYVFKNNRIPPVQELTTGLHIKKEINPKAAQDARKYFQLDSFVNLVKEKEEYIEISGFASKLDNIISYYLSNIDLLNTFVLYFKEKADKLISRSYTEGVFVENYETFLRNSKKKSGQKEKLMEKLILNKYYFGERTANEYISLKGLQCLKYRARGRSKKEIGRLLNMSERTVETHLNNIKKRLGLWSNLQLVELYENIDLNKLLEI